MFDTLKKYSSSQYLSVLQALLPQGMAWSRSPDALLTKTLHAIADEFARVDANAHLLMSETNPATAIDGLEDWERVLGLPDGCLPAGQDIEERRYAVLHLLTNKGRSDIAYWYEVAAALGYNDVVIEEHCPFICGQSEVSDAAQFTPEQEQLSGLGRCGPEEIRYWWNVIVRGSWFTLFRTGAESLPPDNLQDLTTAESYTRLFRTGTSSPPNLLGEYIFASTLECIFKREKPAHTYLTFEYEEVSA